MKPPNLKKILLPHINKAIKSGGYDFIAKDMIRIYVLTGNIFKEAETYVIEIRWTKK